MQPPLPSSEERRILSLRSSVQCLWLWFWCLLVFMVFVLLVSIAALFSPHHNHDHIHNDITSSRIQSHHKSLYRFKMTKNMKFIEKGVYYLGKAYDPKTYHIVKGYTMFLYYDPSTTVSVIQKKSHGTGPCFEPFSEGSRWKMREDFVIDSTNNQGLTEKYFLDMNWLAICEWDSKLNFRIFGNRDNNSIADGPDEISPDGKNEIQFGFIDEPNVIAFTTVWGIFDGPIINREIIEADILYNLNFQWGNVSTTEGRIMDGQSIGTHELGHYIGTGHTPNADATMFNNANFRETKKRSLLPCEIEGLCIHYGESETCPGHDSTGTVPPRPFSLSIKLLNNEHKLIICCLLIIITFI